MKKQFFRSKFQMFIVLTLVPICIFGIISFFYINMQVKEEAKEKTLSTTELIAQTMGDLTSSLEFYRVTAASNVRLHLALIGALNNDTPDTEAYQKLKQSMQSLYYAQNTKPYIQSIFLTANDSKYYINGINRETFLGATDAAWASEAEGVDKNTFIKLRNVKKNKFDTNTVPTVTVYQRLKYKELMAINITPDYFNQWLDSITAYSGQILLITDELGQILFANTNQALLSSDLEEKAVICTQNVSPPNSLLDGYFYNAGTFPGEYGFRYISLIPQKEVFKLPNTIMRLTIAAGLLSIILSSILAYYYTMRDYKQLFQIIDLFEKAEKGEFIPQEPINVPNHAYFHIITNVINLFMSQTYLKVQLDAKKYALSTAQLSALQYQLNPHFLFNTLQSIDLEILKIGRKPTTANKMISELSQLLRYSLDEPKKQVTVGEEILVTQNYIDLQTVRLGDVFTVHWDYNDDILDTPILRLLLQPLIENSLTHSGLNESKKLIIKIKLRQIQGSLTFFIIDNGQGVTVPRLKELRGSLSDDQVDTSGKHIGLKNISQRIRLAYPDGYVKIQSKYSMGTLVEIGGIQPDHMFR